MVEKSVINTQSVKKITMLIIFYTPLYITENEMNNSLFYILIWSSPHLCPYPDPENGQQYFINHNCSFQNCFSTANKSYFNDLRDFDVILFNTMTFNLLDTTQPTTRSDKQKYIFMSYEPPAMFPVPSHYNGFFNFTWTYRLDSDATLKYLVIRNEKGEVIGPRKDMHWMDFNDMKPVSENIKSKLQNKSKAVAWFVTKCDTPSQREVYVRKLNDELRKYELHIDIFGQCGDQECTKHDEKCLDMLESDYYYYLAFENSMCEDYVTEKLLAAVKHLTVPIVYGGANYTRFMPKGMYLDANIIQPGEMARIINDTIHDINKYYDLFKWHNYYSFHYPSESADTDEVCAFCAFLNDKIHRYLPKGSYLNANASGPQVLAGIMNDTLYDKNKYFFFQRSQLSYHYAQSEIDELCEFCTYLNEKKYELRYEKEALKNIYTIS